MVETFCWMMFVRRFLLRKVCRRILTILFVKLNFNLQLCFSFQCLFNFRFLLLVSARPIQELAGTPLLHDVGPGVPGQVTEPV